jgi:hypothetical protein
MLLVTLTGCQWGMKKDPRGTFEQRMTCVALGETYVQTQTSDSLLTCFLVSDNIEREYVVEVVWDTNQIPPKIGSERTYLIKSPKAGTQNVVAQSGHPPKLNVWS